MDRGDGFAVSLSSWPGYKVRLLVGETMARAAPTRNAASFRVRSRLPPRRLGRRQAAAEVRRRVADVGRGDGEPVVEVGVLAVGFDEVAAGRRAGGEAKQREHGHAERDAERDARAAHPPRPRVRPPSKR